MKKIIIIVIMFALIIASVLLGIKVVKKQENVEAQGKNNEIIQESIQEENVQVDETIENEVVEEKFKENNEIEEDKQVSENKKTNNEVTEEFLEQKDDYTFLKCSKESIVSNLKNLSIKLVSTFNTLPTSLITCLAPKVPKVIILATLLIPYLSLT